MLYSIFCKGLSHFGYLLVNVNASIGLISGNIDVN